MSGPLEGVKVLELSMFQQGPVAGMRLGDLGADVVKIEAPSGDPARYFMRIIGAMAGLKGPNYYFEHCNRNKRAMVLDMKKPEAMEIFLKLIDQVDVFVNNLSIGAPGRMGIGPEALLERNPRLIYAQASGWGRKGPDAEALSFDYTGIGRSGLMMSGGEAGSPPTQMLPGVGDEMGALVCAWGVCAALYAREKTGKGQVVDTSLMGSVIANLGLIMAAPAILGQEFPRETRAKAGNPMYNHYRCSDDKWLAIAHLQPERYWPKVLKALDLMELENNPRFDSVEARGQNAQALVALFDEKFAQKTRDQWLAILAENSCIATPIQAPMEVVEDPQVVANNYVLQRENPEEGPARTTGFPWDFSATPASYRRKAPELGEHTDEVLTELGFDAEQIAKLREDKVVG
ncbi:MAG: CoA transferase [Desulfarculus sp.]|nr:CoA transferase [Pseudomonadota bacterium]MBV1718238.1 CoA transferase [Desulfarculus sp.]MBU4576617.1 CoA transferase [Pseudomonadota bacterium]MBU4597797.1 CoA transferase [Pseudomonadota bacterium]MBV1738010.1 CoA transferase [Desulfarculus sp.]